MTTQPIEPSKEFGIIDKFRHLKGKDRIDMVLEGIRDFLREKIHPSSVDFLYYVHIDGQRRLFEIYDCNEELGVHGGQISCNVYSNDKKYEVIRTGIAGENLNFQADNFWEFMEPNKGFIDVYFTYYEGPGEKTFPPFGNRSLYDGNDMTAYRFSFKLQRKSESQTVVLYDLQIITEKWERQHKKVVIKW